MGRGVKRIAAAGIAQVLHATGWLARHRKRSRLSILTFHRVLPEDLRQAYPLPGLAVTPGELSWLLGRLRGHYECGPLELSFERWRNPEPGALPPLAITFDDCTADEHRYGRPILAQHGIRASFFAPAQLIEDGEALWHDRIGFAVAALRDARSPALEPWLRARGIPSEPGSELPPRVVGDAKRQAPQQRAAWARELEELVPAPQTPDWARLMTWHELQELASDGHELGSHGMAHEILPQLDAEALEREVTGSRRLLAERLGGTIDSFCYPNGDEDDAVVAAVRTAGYRLAVTTRGGTNESAMDPLRLHRFDMKLDYVTDGGGAPSEPLLLFRVSGLHPAAR